MSFPRRWYRIRKHILIVNMTKNWSCSSMGACLNANLQLLTSKCMDTHSGGATPQSSFLPPFSSVRDQSERDRIDLSLMNERERELISHWRQGERERDRENWSLTDERYRVVLSLMTGRERYRERVDLSLMRGRERERDRELISHWWEGEREIERENWSLTDERDLISHWWEREGEREREREIVDLSLMRERDCMNS